MAFFHYMSRDPEKETQINMQGSIQDVVSGGCI